MNTTMNVQPKKEIYRYKFSQEFMDHLEIFAIEHEDFDITNFKEAWESWTEENASLIAKEITLLLENNFQGDALDKMFFSARYYYRKKETRKTSSKHAPKEKKQNIKYASSRAFLEQMDNHIQSQDTKTKPSKCFDNFVKHQYSFIEEEYRAYLNKQEQDNANTTTLDEKAFQEKMKKTYKNRIFVIRRGLSLQ
jgi:hypothetical protein